jgi:glycosyl hydrolase family 18 (putative chitinase)
MIKLGDVCAGGLLLLAVGCSSGATGDGSSGGASSGSAGSGSASASGETTGSGEGSGAASGSSGAFASSGTRSQATTGQSSGEPSVDAAGSSGAASGGGASGTGEGSGSAQESGSTRPPPSVNKQSLLWLWQGYSGALDTLAANPKAFTHVAPAFYQLNYSYTSGAAQFNGGNSFDGMSAAQVTQKIHAAGMKCAPMVQAGAGNNGVDQGIQNVLDDQPSGAQSSFITSMVTEAQSNGYDGYNLDWEVNNLFYSDYGQKYLSFLSAFKQALNAHQMALSIDIGDWYTLQCDASCTTGLVDLTHIGQSVDSAIFMDYSDNLGTPGTSCPAVAGLLDCDNFSGGLNVMCNVMPPQNVSIGLIAGPGSAGANAYLDKALDDIASYGFSAVAVWPGSSAMPSSQGVPGGATWYSLLGAFLAK